MGRQCPARGLSFPFDNDECPVNYLIADVAIRKPQHFKPAPGKILHWSVSAASNPQVFQTGTTVVQADSLVVIPGVEMFKSNHDFRRIRVQDMSVATEQPGASFRPCPWSPILRRVTPSVRFSLQETAAETSRRFGRAYFFHRPSGSMGQPVPLSGLGDLPAGFYYVEIECGGQRGVSEMGENLRCGVRNFASKTPFHMKHLFLTLAFAACWAAPAFSQFHFACRAVPTFLLGLAHQILIPTSITSPAWSWRYAAMERVAGTPWIGLRAELGTQVKSNKLAGLQFPDMIDAQCGRSESHSSRKWRAVSPGRRGTSRGADAGLHHRKRRKILQHHSAVIQPLGLSRIGGNVPLGALSRLKIEGRFQYGLSNFSKNDNVDARVSSVLFTLGYLHRL